MVGLPGRASRLPCVRQSVPTLVVLFMCAHGAHHLVTALPVPLLPFIRNEFGLDYTQAALVVSAFSVPYGIAQMPSGWLADRIGPRLLLLMGTSGIAAAALLVGVSTNYMMLLSFLILMGLLGGGYHPSAPSVIIGATEPSRRGRTLGLHMLGGSMVHFIAPMVAAALATAWGWRSPFVALSIPSVAFGIAFYVFLGRRARRVAQEATSEDTHVEAGAVMGRWQSVAAVVVLSCFTTAFVLSAASFCPLFLVDFYGYQEQEGAAAISLIYSAGLWAAPLGGYVSDRIGRLKVISTVGLVAGPMLVVLGSGVGHLVILGILILLGAVFYGGAPATEVYVMANTPPGRRSTVLGLYYFGGMEGSGVLAPVVGFLIDRYGFSTAFSASGIALLVIALACVAVLVRSTRTG